MAYCQKKKKKKISDACFLIFISFLNFCIDQM